MKDRYYRAANIIVLVLVTIMMHQTIFVCYLEGLVPPRSCAYGSAGGQLSGLFIIVLFTLWVIRIKGWARDYLKLWRSNWILAMFVVFALLSLFWTVYPPATIYRALILLSVTLIAAYVGILFSTRDLVLYIAITAGVSAAASLILAAILPDAAIMNNPPYVGLWRGIFWHKIYLGAMMALGCAAYLVIVLSPVKLFPRFQKIPALVMFILCGYLALLSDSASGLVTLTVEVILIAAVYSLLSWGHLISRRNYWMIGIFLMVIAIIVSTNLGFVFGLYNRSSTLTGRTFLWMHLLNNYVPNRPLLGHGFGAFWLQPGINDAIQSVVNWGYPVKVSDNGYMDVLLGLGWPGLSLLVLILGSALIRAVRKAQNSKLLTDYFPAFLLVHILLINISLSYFAEMESFVWFLLVVIVFLCNRESKAENTP